MDTQYRKTCLKCGSYIEILRKIFCFEIWKMYIVIQIINEIVPNISFNNYNSCCCIVMTSNYVKQKKVFQKVNSFWSMLK